ncbi:MAG: gliding motility-associated C-terminal domain-containing protein, partial [Bacteroidetes bacterium]|nr:gliding motility-associated C-terminal domain-containing protein [Bacteroidota bacterium]
EKVFQSNDVSVLWDGTYKEEQVQQGYYIYILTYRTKGQAFKTQSGDLYILN